MIDPSLEDTSRHIEGKPKLHSNILLDQSAWAVQWEILFSIHTEFILVLPAKREAHNPIELGWGDLIARLPIGEHVHIAVQHDLVLIEIDIRMRDIPEQCFPGIVGTCKIIAVLK